MLIKRGLIALALLSVIGVAGFMARPHVQASAKVVATYPVKPINLVVTFPPGGGTDLLARKLGAELEQRWKTPVIVENRPGASGNIGARYVADSQADGYTLLMVNSSFAINPGVYRQLGFNPKTDFDPIINVAWIPSVFVVGENSKAQTLGQALRQTPDSVAIASCGNGTPQHLAAEMLTERVGATLLHVPYRGCGPAITDIMSGQVPLGVVTISSAIPFVNSGKLKPLAVTSPEPSSALAGVPAVTQEGIKNYELNQWHGLLAPAGTPTAVVEKLNATLSEIMSDEKMLHYLENIGYTPTRSTADEFKRIIDADIDRFSVLTQRVGININ